MKKDNNNVVNLNSAGKKARLREIENEKILTEEELLKAAELQIKANSRGMILIPERKVKNRARFVQLNQANLLYLREIKYLTTAEKTFLMDIAPHVEIESNCIVEDCKKANSMPLTQSDLAVVLGKKKQNVNPIIKGLIDKGILARSESGLEDNNVRAYALFVNPHIMFSGDRDNVNGTLKAMFRKTPAELKKLPEKLY
ncbi:MarR family transcriptional regulator [Niallia sp. 01092]|uniref:MarR family transcriptional regulator n=1 Tax=Niallia sp. 01092 TaxID=3457759 RepID=UPI003FCEE864